MPQFLDLPLEVREEIYRLALPRKLGVFSRAHDHCKVPACMHDPGYWRRVMYQEFHSEPPTEAEESLALLTVSRSVSGEVSQLISRELPFSFHCLGSLARATERYPAIAPHFWRDLRVWMTLWEWIGMTDPRAAAPTYDFENLRWHTLTSAWSHGGHDDTGWSHIGDPVVMGNIAGETLPRSERLEIVLEAHLGPSMMSYWADRVRNVIVGESFALRSFLKCADERTYVCLQNAVEDPDIALIKFNVAEVKREAKRGRTRWEEVSFSR